MRYSTKGKDAVRWTTASRDTTREISGARKKSQIRATTLSSPEVCADYKELAQDKHRELLDVGCGLAALMRLLPKLISWSNDCDSI
jgi:hypothetical protein